MQARESDASGERLPERYPIAAYRDRWLDLLELEHDVLAPAVDFGAEGEDLLVWREPIEGRPIAGGRVPRSSRAALFLQAAAAGAFFAARGIGLGAVDLDDAVWDDGGGPRLWLTRTPEAARTGGPASPAAGLESLLRRLYDYGGRIASSPAQSLARRLAAPEAALRRPEYWVAEAFRAFPELARLGSAGARQRCLGLPGRALRTARARALAEKARAILSGSAPRLFGMDGSPLTPGGALGLDPPARSVGDASRRLRAGAGVDRRLVWIAVAPERWDPLSRRSLDAARLALGDQVQWVTVPESLPMPEGPDEWRRALWIPCGTIAASVRFYEWFAELGQMDSARARVSARAFLSSPELARYVADPTGDAPVPALDQEPAPERAPGPPVDSGSVAASGDPGRAIELLLQVGRKDLALDRAKRWVLAQPERGVEAWFSLSARLAAEVDDAFVPWLEAIEAEREIAGGRLVEARARLDRIERETSPSAAERRRAGLRAAEVAVLLGDAKDGGRRAAAWRRTYRHPPAQELVRALRLLAAVQSRDGRIEPALDLLREAERRGAALPDTERVETALARAQVLALAGRFEEETALYEALRPLALGAADEKIASRFLAQEARGLLDRRDYRRAIVRLEEAIAAARDDPGELAALSLDLAATLYHAGDSTKSEASLQLAASAAAAAGREDLARIARGNRIELLINRCAFVEAEQEIAALQQSARSDRDEPRLLVALHHRSRLALRRGHLAAAARDNAAARELSERLCDRLEIGELWLEQGDRCAYESDLAGARVAWEKAAADPPDRCDSDDIARERLRELSWREQGGPPPAAVAELDALAARDPVRAAESVARWTGLCGGGLVAKPLQERATRTLCEAGARALAERVFGAIGARTSEDALRALRRAVVSALQGEDAAPRPALESLGLSGLSVRDVGGREIVHLGVLPAQAVGGPGVPLDAGGARFTLVLAPPDSEDVARAVALLLETLLYRAEADSLPREGAAGWARLGIVTADASMDEPYRRLARFAPQPVTVLVLGESGCGKEAVARAIHRLSPRSSGPFIAVNIPSIPAALLESELFGHARGAFTGAERERRGLLEESSGGTIFFDEIGDLAAPLQANLLRALQEREIRRVGENRSRPVDLRVVSATSRDLAREVEAGRFREDLYYRLHVALIRLPPLRDRGRDALVLARHFLERYAAEFGRGALRLSAEAAAALVSHPWPGNVRELQNAMAQAVALADRDGLVTPGLLPEAVRAARRAEGPPSDYRTRVDAHRRNLIADALDRSGGNRSRAARDLGLSRQALLYLIRELKVPEQRPGRGSRV